MTHDETTDPNELDSSNTPQVNDRDQTNQRVQEMGDIIKNLDVGDRVRVTANRWGRYVEGTVTKKTNKPGDNEIYFAFLDAPVGQIELYVDWHNIPENSHDQETPYTGAKLEPFDDTSPAVTDIEVIDE